MGSLAKLLSISSGFVLMGYHLPASVTVGTSIAIDLSLGPLTIFIAHRHGRSTLLWTVLGFCFGVWALGAALLMVRPPAAPPDGKFPTSDAA